MNERRHGGPGHKGAVGHTFAKSHFHRKKARVGRGVTRGKRK